jgi:hypothetical protein
MESIILIVAIVFLFICFLIGANFLAINYLKQKIHRSAEKKGWRIVNILYHYTPGWDKDYSFQKFEVDFIDEQGRNQKGACRLRGPFSAVDWIV